MWVNQAVSGCARHGTARLHLCCARDAGRARLLPLVWSWGAAEPVHTLPRRHLALLAACIMWPLAYRGLVCGCVCAGGGEARSGGGG